jgi:hypothetical protein
VPYVSCALEETSKTYEKMKTTLEELQKLCFLQGFEKEIQYRSSSSKNLGFSNAKTEELETEKRGISICRM